MVEQPLVLGHHVSEDPVTLRARDVRLLLFAASLYAITGYAVAAASLLGDAEKLLTPNPWYGGGVGGGWS